jgi:positive regulator of sigma E activity
MYVVSIGVQRVSTQFQQTCADYVAECSCGWNMRSRIGSGEMTMRQMRTKARQHLTLHNEEGRIYAPSKQIDGLKGD